MDCLAYVKECLGPIRKQFLKRGYTVVDAEPVFKKGGGLPQLDSNLRIVVQADILLQDHTVGLVRINFHRWTRARQIGSGDMDSGHITNGGNPIKQKLEIEISGWERFDTFEFGLENNGSRLKETRIALKSSSFFRGTSNPHIIGTPLFDLSGRIMKGKPKIRKFAAFAAKKFVEEFMPKVTGEAVEHVMES
jgi:hypothetical protein